MKLLLILCTFLILPISAVSQNVQNRDSIINRMCEDLNKNKHLTDSLRINEIYNNHFYPYLAKVNKKDVDSVAKSVFYRFQKQCLEFIKILKNNEPGKGDWEIISLEEKPKSVASTSDCKNIVNLKNLSYLENNGDQVLVKIENGFWIEKFVDSTNSKLKFNWINNCEFQLEFLESNNEIRGSLSIKGDTYNYEIIKKEASHLSMFAYIPKKDMYLTFKIYFD